MSVQAKAASITPPVQGKNLWVFASSDSSTAIECHPSWNRSFLTIEADGVDVYVAFSDDPTATADPTATSTVTSGVITAVDGDECRKIPDGQERDFDLSALPWSSDDGKKLYLVIVSSASGGYVRVTRSSGLVAL